MQALNIVQCGRCTASTLRHLQSTHQFSKIEWGSVCMCWLRPSPSQDLRQAKTGELALSLGRVSDPVLPYDSMPGGQQSMSPRMRCCKVLLLCKIL